MVGYDDLKEKQLSSRGHGIAGILSGTFTRFLTQPLDVLKIRFQLQHEPLKPESHNYYWNMRQAIRRIFHEESYRAMWKGHIPAQLLSATYGFAQFKTFEFCTKFVHQNVTAKGKRVTDFGCGMLSGAVATMVSMPCDTLRTRLVGQGEPKVYRGIIDAFVKMVRYEGITSLYRGLFPSILQIMPQAGVQFTSFRLFSELYWVFRSQKSSDQKLPVIGNLICGGVAGIVAKISVYPLDLSKKRLQVQGFEEARLHFGSIAKYNGLFDCLRQIIRDEGIRALYKGVGPSTLKAGISTALTFTFYEEFSHLFMKLDLFRNTS